MRESGRNILTFSKRLKILTKQGALTVEKVKRKMFRGSMFQTSENKRRNRIVRKIEHRHLERFLISQREFYRLAIL